MLFWDCANAGFCPFDFIYMEIERNGVLDMHVEGFIDYISRFVTRGEGNLDTIQAFLMRSNSCPYYKAEEFFPAVREYLHSVYGSYVCGYVEGYTEENDEEGVEDVRVGTFLETYFPNSFPADVPMHCSVSYKETFLALKQ